MIFLKVPFSEKDEAKALGARWNKDRKAWYIPDGQATAPFERWHVPGQAGNAPEMAKISGKEIPSRVDSYAGKVVTGEHYIELNHNCSPFIECSECRPILEASGWIAAGDALKQMLKTLTVTVAR